jgi:hypothetical protein
MLQQSRLLIDNLLEFAALVQSLDAEVGWQTQFGKAEICAIRILQDEQGVVPFAEETRMLPGSDRTVRDHMRIGDEGGQIISYWGQFIDDRAIGREQIERIAQPLIVGWRGMAGQRIIAGRVVILHGVVHRAH